MNRFLFIRNSLIEIYNRRNILLENLTKEVDKYDTSKKNYGESYYNHVKLLLTEIELNLKNAIPRGNNYLPYPPKDELIQTNFDFFMAVTGIDMTTIHSLGYFEPSETVLTQRITNYSQTLFDVGANLGYFSFLFNCFSQTDSKVYAFEPENYNFERLTKAVTINDQKERLSTFKIALSDLCSEELLYINRRGSGGHSLVKTQPEIFSERHEIISVYTLDDFLKENNIDGQDSFLKIDVEGAELKVLEGSLNFLSNKKPVAILCEIWAEDKTKSNTHLDIISKIVDFGYSGYSVQIPSFGSPLLKPIFFENKFNQSYNDNYLFIRSDRIDIIKSCLEPLKWFELVSNQGLEDLLDIQEKSLLSLIEYHTASVPMEKSKYYKHYISSSDGGYPLINNYDPRPVAAKIRFHHNCGGPAILTFVDKNTCDLVTSIVVGNSEKYKNDEGHYSVPHEEAARIVKEDIIKYKPDIVLLMPNNVTSFNKEELNKLRNVYKFFLAARDGDACSYDSERIEKNLQIAGSVDYFISVDGEFVELAESKGYSNVEYIPSFVNEHLVPNKTDIKIYDILFTGVGWVGEQMDNGETMYKRRRSFIRKVNEIYGNKFKVFGHAWDDLYLANWTNEFISEDYVHTYAGKTKIVIAFDGPYAKGFTSVRVFRALMSGAFVLIRYFPGIENIFENHKHLVWFHGDEEGLSAIDYYLNNDAEREKIAWMGKEYLLSQKGWRRKNIIVDYLIEKTKGSKYNFSDSNENFRTPRCLTNRILKKTVDILRNNISIINTLDVISYAESLIEQASHEEAAVILQSVLDYDNNLLEALIDLSVLNVYDNKIDSSLELIARVLLIDKDNTTANYNIGILKEQYGEEKISITFKNELIKLKTERESKFSNNLNFWKDLQCRNYFDIHPQGRGMKLFGNDYEIISRFINLKNYMNVVVIGCGYGRDSVLIAPHVKHVYGIDVNDKILSKAKEFTTTHNIFNFTGVLAEEFYYQIPQNIDFIFSHAVFQHMSRNLVWDYIEILKRKLNPGGKFLCRFLEESGEAKNAHFDVFEPNVSWSINEIEDLISMNNLKKIMINTIRENHTLLHYAFFSI